MPSKKLLNRDNLSDIILGAHFYACGGGGALKNGQELLLEIDKHFTSASEVNIQYIDLADIDDMDRLPVMAAMGSPQKFLEKGYRHSPISAFNALETLCIIEKTNTSTFTTLSPIETGPIAYGMSLLVAAAKGIPIINGDGGGRAFPCLQLSTFANIDLEEPIAVSPCVLTSEKPIPENGGVIAINCESSIDVDAMTRGIISTSISFDDRASLASFYMTGKQLKQPNALVPDMLIKSQKLGAHIRECITNNLSCFGAIEALDGAHCVMQGKLNDIRTTTVDGFDWVTQEYISHCSSKTAYVISQNENMILWSDDMDTPIALAPDLICCISSDATLMSNDEIVEAWHQEKRPQSLQEMAIFTLPAASQIKQPWFHENFSVIFKKLGYFGSYHPPITSNTGGAYAE